MWIKHYTNPRPASENIYSVERCVHLHTPPGTSTLMSTQSCGVFFPWIFPPRGLSSSVTTCRRDAVTPVTIAISRHRVARYNQPISQSCTQNQPNVKTRSHLANAFASLVDPNDRLKRFLYAIVQIKSQMQTISLNVNGPVKPCLHRTIAKARTLLLENGFKFFFLFDAYTKWLAMRA